MDVDKLARMANQIAANFDYGSDKDKVAERVADHLQRFWTPSMLAELIEGRRRDTAELAPIAARAVEKLAEPNKTSAA